MMINDRGRGGTGPKKPDKIVERYGISPQLAPPTPSAKSMKCLNDRMITSPSGASK